MRKPLKFLRIISMDSSRSALIGVLTLFVIIAIIAISMWGMPRYRVYSATLQGKAKLMQAEQEKQILIEQASAEKEAASLRAEAIKIMGVAAKEFPEYREQEFMAAFGEAIQDGRISKMIFVPTEANVPIIHSP